MGTYKKLFAYIFSFVLLFVQLLFPFVRPVFAASLPGCADSQNGVCNKVTTGLNIDISTSVGGFTGSLFQLLLSIAGGIAIILIIFSGYNMMMSQGNPEKVKGAQETLTAAIVGLLFMIFSTTILQITGFNILHIPQFGK